MATRKTKRRGPGRKKHPIIFDKAIPSILLMPFEEPEIDQPIPFEGEDFDALYEQEVAIRDDKLRNMIAERWVAACGLFGIQPSGDEGYNPDLIVIFDRIFPGFLPKARASKARASNARGLEATWGGRNPDAWRVYIRSLEIMRDEGKKRSLAWDQAYREHFKKGKNWQPATSARVWRKFAELPWVRIFRDAAKYKGLRKAGLINGEGDLLADHVSAESDAFLEILQAEIEIARGCLGRLLAGTSKAISHGKAEK